MNEVSSVTIYDVATHADVSAMTVSRVLNSPAQVAVPTRERVEQAIEALGYVPNTLARGLRGSTQTLALIIPDVSNPFFTNIVRGAEEVAWENGYTLFLGNTHGSTEVEGRYLRKFRGHGIDGLLIAPSGHETGIPLASIRKRNIPFVLLDARVEGVGADIVLGDSEDGARLLTEHLLALGHRRVALVGGPADKSTAQERERGYRQALKAHGLEPDPSYIRTTDFSRAAGFGVTRDLLALPQPPDALFAANNLLAVGAAEAVREAGLRIPQDVALACFEDLEFASALDPFLTVLAQPAREFGQLGMRFLLERIAEPSLAARERVLPPSLIVRRSCGAELKKLS